MATYEELVRKYMAESPLTAGLRLDPTIEPDGGDPVIDDPVIEDPVVDDPVIEDPIVEPEDPPVPPVEPDDPVIDDPIVDPDPPVEPDPDPFEPPTEEDPIGKPTDPDPPIEPPPPPPPSEPEPDPDDEPVPGDPDDPTGDDTTDPDDLGKPDGPTEPTDPDWPAPTYADEDLESLVEFLERRRRLDTFDGIDADSLRWDGFQGESSTAKSLAFAGGLKREVDENGVPRTTLDTLGQLIGSMRADDYLAMPEHLKGELNKMISAQAGSTAAAMKDMDTSWITSQGIDPAEQIAFLESMTDFGNINAAWASDPGMPMYRGYGDQIRQNLANQTPTAPGPTPTSFSTLDNGGPMIGYGQMFRQRNPFGGGGGFGGGMQPPQMQMGMQNPLPAIGNAIGGAWNAMGENNNERLQMLGGIGGGIANYLQGRQQNDIYKEQNQLRRDQFDADQADKERKRKEYEDWLRRNQMGG